MRRMVLGSFDVALLLRHLTRLRQLVDELDAFEQSISNFHQRQDVRDRLRREIDVTQAAVIAFGPSGPSERRYD
jgi:hypothetical protein